MGFSGAAGREARPYGVRGLPTSYLLDRRGRIVSGDVGARDWSGRVAREIASACWRRSDGAGGASCAPKESRGLPGRWAS